LPTLKSQPGLRPAQTGMQHTIESSRRAVQSCDILLTDAIVLTLDELFTVHRPGSVAIDGDTIRAVGPEAASYTARDTITCRGRVVMPGLINAHTHVPMTLLRGLADHLRLDV